MSRFDATTFWNITDEISKEEAQGDALFEQITPDCQSSESGKGNGNSGPHSDSQHSDSQHSDSQHSDSQHSDSQHSDEIDDSTGKNAFQSGVGDGWGPTDPVASSWHAALAAQTFFVPLHYEPNYAYPLIIWLHSDGFNENQVNHVMPHISTRNYIATGIRGPVAIDANGHRFAWRTTSSAMASVERCVFEAINRAQDQYSVHAQRVVIAGYQSGGSTALQIAARHPQRFAAAVSMGGSFAGSVADSSLQQNPAHPPMLWQHALASSWYDQDQLVQDVKQAMAIRAKVEIRQYQMDDEMNTAVLADLDRWMMNHVVNGQPVAKVNTWDSSPVLFSDN